MVELKRDGVGVYTIICEKEVEKVWFYLSKEEKNYPIWESISSEYEGEHQIYQKYHDNK